VDSFVNTTGSDAEIHNAAVESSGVDSVVDTPRSDASVGHGTLLVAKGRPIPPIPLQLPPPLPPCIPKVVDVVLVSGSGDAARSYGHPESSGRESPSMTPPKPMSLQSNTPRRHASALELDSPSQARTSVPGRSVPPPLVVRHPVSAGDGYRNHGAGNTHHKGTGVQSTGVASAQ